MRVWRGGSTVRRLLFIELVALMAINPGIVMSAPVTGSGPHRSTCPDSQTVTFYRQQLAISKGLPAGERQKFDARLRRWLIEPERRCQAAHALVSCGHGLRC